jgi:hypothetical protein
MSIVKVFPKIAILFGLCLLNTLIIAVFLSDKVQSATGVGNAHIEVQDLDFSEGVAKLLVVFEEETGSDDFRERSTSWLVIEQLNTGHGIIAFPIGRADPDWKCVGTNNVTLWHWRLEKTFHLRYQTNGNPSLIFPFELFKATFYVATNISRWFTASIDVPNFSISVNEQYADYNQSSWTFQPEGCPYFLKFDLYILHSLEYRVITMMLYIVLSIVITIAVFLTKKRDDIPSSDFFRISSSLLIFLPVFFFTFRNSMAPQYLTTFDMFCFFGAIIYGSLLLWKLIRFRSEESEEIQK